MMHQLLNQMRLQTQIAISNLKTVRMGIISNFDPANYTAQAIIQPQDNQFPQNSNTGWLPLFSPWVGNGWGFFAPPQIGAMCAVHYSESNQSGAFITLCGFNKKFAPLEVDSGECWLVHESGSYIKLTNDGNIYINAATVQLGDIAAGSLKKLLTEAAATVYNSHTHTGDGEPPTQQMDATDMTMYTEAN